MAKITTFKAGYCTHPSCVAVRGTGFKTCQFPAQTYLLEAQGHYWLWDTGYASHFVDATQKGIFKLYAKITPVYFSPNEAIKQQLAQRGITENDLTGLILSHFHGDHIAGLKDFPKTPYICSADGWNKLKNKKGFTALKQGFVPALIPSGFEDRVVFVEQFEGISLPSELTPFMRGYALPKSNNEIILVDLPGHAAGHIGAFVSTPTGWVLLASDAAWSVKNYRDLAYPMKIANLIMDSPQRFQNTLQMLHTLDKNGHVRIKLSHEVDELETRLNNF